MYAKDILSNSWHKCHIVKNQAAKRILKVFGEAVREARLRKNLSQERLGLDTELDLTTINEIERGHRSPQLVTVCKIAKGLGVKPADLLKNL